MLVAVSILTVHKAPRHCLGVALQGAVADATAHLLDVYTSVTCNTESLNLSSSAGLFT